MEQVEKCLPKIQKLVLEMQGLQKTLDLLETIEIEGDEDDHEVSRSITKLNKSFHRLSYEFFRKLDCIEAHQGVLRDLDRGLIDFKTTFEGREVFLCWKIGERSIQHWHELEDGFAGRRKIVDLGKLKV
jgi:hypothetical protein